MTEPAARTRLHPGIQFTFLLFTAAFLAFLGWNSDSPVNRWIAGPFAVFFAVAGLWKALRFHRPYLASH